MPGDLRPSEEAVWLGVAAALARRSRCVRSQVGCVLVGADGRVVSTGYNGPPAGWEPGKRRESCASFCPRHDVPDGTGAPDFSDCPAAHAELNALLYSDRDHRVGGTAYLTRDPCWACAVALAASGLAAVVWPWPAGTELTERAARVSRFLRDCRVSVRTWSA